MHRQCYYAEYLRKFGLPLDRPRLGRGGGEGEREGKRGEGEGRREGGGGGGEKGEGGREGTKEKEKGGRKEKT